MREGAQQDIDPILFIIAGPTGTGKTTTMERLDREGRVPDAHYIHATVTSRPPRPYEVDGTHFHFWTRERIMDLVDQGEVLEFAENHGNLYCTPYSFVPTDRDALVVFDIGAAVRTRAKLDRVVVIFLTPTGGLFDLDRRLRRRGDATNDIKRRLNTAEFELAQQHRADYIVPCVEGRLDQMVDFVAAIIARERAERDREVEHGARRARYFQRHATFYPAPDPLDVIPERAS